MDFYYDYGIVIFAAAVALPVLLCVVHYVSIGPRDPELGRLPRAVRRLTIWDRLVHAVRLVTFVMAAVSGFGFVVGGSPPAHLQLGMVFALTSLLTSVLWFRQSLFRADDRAWLAHLGGLLSKAKPEFKSGKFNAGQKLFMWVSLAFAAALAITGILLETRGLPESGSLRAAHGLLAVILTALVIGHVYLSVWAVPGTWRAMITGKVAREWLACHHPEDEALQKDV